MTIFLCSTQADIFRFLARKIEKKGHTCLLFGDYTSYLKTLSNSKELPDLAILDYTLENHLISKNPYESLCEKKQYMPLIFYNDPCIAEGARLEVWKSIIESTVSRDYAPKDKFYIPTIEELEKILIMVVDFIESREFRPYIKLMQQPEEFPKQMTLDFLEQSFIKKERFSLLDLKDQIKLPDNLYILFKIFYENEGKLLEIEKLLEEYASQKAQISEKSLCVLISQLRSALKKISTRKFLIKKLPGGYTLESE